MPKIWNMAPATQRTNHSTNFKLKIKQLGVCILNMECSANVACDPLEFKVYKSKTITFQQHHFRQTMYITLNLHAIYSNIYFRS